MLSGFVPCEILLCIKLGCIIICEWSKYHITIQLSDFENGKHLIAGLVFWLPFCQKLKIQITENQNFRFGIFREFFYKWCFILRVFPIKVLFHRLCFPTKGAFMFFLRWFFYWRLLDHWPSFCLNHLILKCYSRKFKIQWGSEIRLSPDFKWSKRGKVANGLDFEWDLKSRSPTIWNPDKLPPFFQKPFETRTKMSGYVIFGTITKALPFENWSF